MDRLNLCAHGDGWRIVHCKDTSDGVVASPLGKEPFLVVEGQAFDYYGVACSQQAIEGLYKQLRAIHGDDNKPYHDDMRAIAFGLLDVLKAVR